MFHFLFILAYANLFITSKAPGIEFTKDSLRIAVNKWVSNKAEAMEEYGDVRHWDAGKVTNMESLFHSKNTFNENLSEWDTANMTRMHGMFNKAGSFNGNISKWDPSQVTRMTRMFERTSAFNIDISEWDISGVNDMTAPFNGAVAFNQQLCWDMSGTMHTRDMFNASPRSIECD